MKKMIFAAAIAAILVSAVMIAAAQDAKRMLTISEVVEIGNALRGLKTYTAQDRSGAAITLSYKFDGPTLMTMANNIRKADDVTKAYQEAVNALIVQISDGGSQVPPDKMVEFNKQLTAMGNQRTSIDLGRMREGDLKMGDQPLAPATIAALLPILDK